MYPIFFVFDTEQHSTLIFKNHRKSDDIMNSKLVLESVNESIACVSCGKWIPLAGFYYNDNMFVCDGSHLSWSAYQKDRILSGCQSDS